MSGIDPTNLIGNIGGAIAGTIADVTQSVLGTTSTLVVTMTPLTGQFTVGEEVTSGTAIGQIVSVDYNNNILTIQMQLGTISVPAVIVGTSGATAAATGIGSSNPFDFISLFPGGTPPNFDFTNYISSINTSNFTLPSVDTIFNISNTVSSGGEISIVYKDIVASVTNPANTFAQTLTYGTDRYIQQHAIEPNFPFKGEYPYVKTNRTESGHLIEIDDTPGHERLLQQHKSGTYEEIHQTGDRVMKIVGRNHHITLHDENVYVEGTATVSVKGNVTLRVGGSVIVQAEKGMSFISAGDIRMKANNIVMEATKGNVELLANIDIKATAGNNTHLSSKNNFLTSSANTEVSVGSHLDLISQSATSLQSDVDINFKAGTDFKALAGGTMNLAAAGQFNGDGATVHFQEGASVAPTVPGSVPTANVSYGTGLTYSTVVEHMFLESDDDPQQFAQAAQAAIKAGLITQDDLNATATGAGSADTTAPSSNGTIQYKVAPVASLTSFPVNLQLSPHFTLGRLTIGTPAGAHPLKAQYGLTEAQLASNLQLLSLNILEKIYTKYPDMSVTSAFRSDNTTGSNLSQHCKGQAADIQFASAQQNPELYLTYAQWIRDNIPGFDQLLLEHNSFGNKPYWLHLSFNVNNPRGQVLTLFNNRTFAQGLQFIKT